MSTVIGGAMLPHAPQFFTMPDTEDKRAGRPCARHRRRYRQALARARRVPISGSSSPTTTPSSSSTPPRRPSRSMSAARRPANSPGRTVSLESPERDRVRTGAPALTARNFDPAFSSTAKIDYGIGIPLTHLGHTGPVLPIGYVNAYTAPSRPWSAATSSARRLQPARHDGAGAKDRDPVERQRRGRISPGPTA